MNPSANHFITIDLYKFRIMEIEIFMDQTLNYINFIENNMQNNIDNYMEKIQKYKNILIKLHQKKNNLEARIDFLKDEIRRLNNLPLHEWMRINLNI
jgi:translation initiation factor 2B subunit (eIF-2B alpha/beta/delta family)